MLTTNSIDLTGAHDDDCVIIHIIHSAITAFFDNFYYHSRDPRILSTNEWLTKCSVTTEHRNVSGCVCKCVCACTIKWL